MSKLKSALAAMLITAFSAAMAIAQNYKLGDLTIIDPTTRAMIPGAEVGGGFLVITNHGNEADRLVSASSPSANEVQLHEMRMDGDVMKMAQLANGIEIPPGATIELKPGGLHIMFMQVPEPFKEGETVKATLVFEKAGSIDVEFRVDPPGKPKMSGDHSAN